MSKNKSSADDDFDSEATGGNGNDLLDAKALETAIATKLGMPVDDSPEESAKSDLFVCKKDCLNCSHLLFNIPGTKVFSCTHENGNTTCPAKWMTISIGVDVEKAARSMYRARVENNFGKMAKHMKRLEKLNPKTAKQILDRVDELALAAKREAESATAAEA